MRAFQQREGLGVDGVVGPNTAKALFAGATAANLEPPLVWYEEASRLRGLREGPGRADNPVILDWAKDLDIAYPHDDIPWCGLFVSHCVGATLAAEKLPNNPLSARAWLKFGSSIKPQLGAVLVFWRGKKDGWQGHVGFYAGEDATAFHVLGGNQGDAVSIARISRDRLLDARWPTSAAGITGRIVQAQAGGGLSTNEA